MSSRSAGRLHSYAFGLHLAGAAVRAVGLFRVGGVDGVKFGVGNFMDSRLDGLQLAHALLDGNAVVEQMKVPCAPPSMSSNPMGTGEACSNALKKS